MLPRILDRDDSERLREQRRSLPAIRDIFGEYLGKKSIPYTFPAPRPSTFSLADLGSSLPTDSRPDSPDSQGWVRLRDPPKNLSLPAIQPSTPKSTWSRASSYHDSARFESHSRRNSDASSHSTPATSLNRDQLFTLPPIQPSHITNPGHIYGHIAPAWRPTSSSRLAYESHSRSRSTSAAITDKKIGGLASLYALSRRRHTIGPIRGRSPFQFPYPAEHTSRSRPTTQSPSRPPSPVDSVHSRRTSVTDVYPSPSPSIQGLPPVVDNSRRLSVSSASGEDAPTERRKTPAKYQCQYCGKRFNRPSSLKIHHNTHTGEKPFACPFPGCGRHFSVMSNMRRHARIHGEIFPQHSREGSEELLDIPSPPYSSASSTQNTPVIPHTHVSSTPDSSPRFRSLSRLPSSSRLKGHRRSSALTRSHPYSSLPPSSDEDCSSSLEQ